MLKMRWPSRKSTFVGPSDAIASVQQLNSKCKKCRAGACKEHSNEEVFSYTREKKNFETVSIVYVFQHRANKSVVLIKSNGDSESAKQLHALRVASSTWRELKQMKVERAMELTERIIQTDNIRHVSGANTSVMTDLSSWNINKREIKYAGVSSSTVGDSSDERVEPVAIGPVCRICGEAVGNRYLLEEHTAVCELRSSIKEKSEGYNKELLTSGELIATEMKESMNHYIQSAIAKFEAKNSLLKKLNLICEKAARLDVTTSTAVNDGYLILDEVASIQKQSKNEKSSARECDTKFAAAHMRLNSKLQYPEKHCDESTIASLKKLTSQETLNESEQSKDVRSSSREFVVSETLSQIQLLLRKKISLAQEMNEQLVTNTTQSGLVRISDFKVIKPISEGGSAKVFLGRKSGTGALYAIKVMNKNYIKGMDMENRVLQERKIMSLISNSNPYIVELFFAFRSRDYLYLVMEYMCGGDCASLLRAVRRLKPAAAQFFISQTVSAVEFLHNHGIVHRDIKPDNMMLTKDGHIKLTDFGLSKMTDSDLGFRKTEADFERAIRRSRKDIQRRINRRGRAKSDDSTSDDESSSDIPNLSTRPIRRRNKLYSPVGTCRYVAPEVVLGVGHDHRVDWWSVGVILFEFLTGFTPFDADSVDEEMGALMRVNDLSSLYCIIYSNILEGDINWPSRNIFELDTKSVIMRLLATNPHFRLGRDGGAQVKAHSYFKEVDWDNLYKQKSLFLPKLSSEEDTSYFTIPTVLASHSTDSDPGASPLPFQEVPDMLPLSLQAENTVFEDPDFSKFSYVNFRNTQNFRDVTIKISRSCRSANGKSRAQRCAASDDARYNGLSAGPAENFNERAHGKNRPINCDEIVREKRYGGRPDEFE